MYALCNQSRGNKNPFYFSVLSGGAKKYWLFDAKTLKN